MQPQLSDPAAPLEIQRQVDAACQAYEEAWNIGRVPSLAEFLSRAAVDARTPLLRELLILELNYRRTEAGQPLSPGELCELHADLMPEIADELKRLGNRTPSASDEGMTERRPASSRDREPTIPLQPKTTAGSGGLHIRCPHCSNPVELLADAAIENITCRTCGSSFSLVTSEEETADAPTLKRIGRFELISRLGMGGFGSVWRARDTELDRVVAVKIPRKGQLLRAEIEQFFREARSAAQLRHPNIVPVHEVGRDGDTIFIVSDLIRGVPLSEWTPKDVPHPREIARLVATVADALQHAHEQGVIHRDLKPSNILLDEAGRPHVMDFGLAKRDVGEITMTMDGQILGTPAYMSPEQARGQGHWTDRRTDIYSLGVVLFRLLTGELPFRGNAQRQIQQRLAQDAPDPSSLNPFLPRDLSTICLKCLERDPNGRFSTAKELADELRRFDLGEPILSRPISRIERVLRWSKRNPALSAAALLTLFLAIAGPITALVIAGQRDRLAHLVSEKDNLIQQYAANKEADAGTIAELRKALDVWEGRATPWELWPPKPTAGPRQELLRVVARHGDQLAARLRQLDDETQRAYGALALAIVYDELKRPDEAIEKYETARELLAKLAADPSAVHYKIALADCYQNLSRLRASLDRNSARKEIEHGRAISQQLATDNDDPRLHATWLEAELDAEILKDRTEGAPIHQQIKEFGSVQPPLMEFAQKIPRDPAQLYELACFLSGREPVLITRQPQPTSAQMLDSHKEHKEHKE